MGPGDHGGMAYEVAIIYHVNPYCVCARDTMVLEHW